MQLSLNRSLRAISYPELLTRRRTRFCYNGRDIGGNSYRWIAQACYRDFRVCCFSRGPSIRIIRLI